MKKIAFLLLASSAFAFEKLDPKYLISYGSPQAEMKAVEYFSLSCPKCLEFFKEEFPLIQKKYVDRDAVSWVFHPDPADLLTLQFMVCVERLSDEHKTLFFETIMENLPKVKNSEQGCRLMQAAMEAFGDPLPDLDKIEFLQKSPVFQDAYRFIAQEDGVRIIPSIEIDGTLHKEYPTMQLIDSIKKRSS